MGVGRG